MGFALVNMVRVLSTTTGTGTLTLGAAVQGFLTPTQAGAVDGTVYTYAIEADYVSNIPTSREVGTGTLGASGTTLTRSVINSTNTNALLNLSGDEQVIIAPLTTSYVAGSDTQVQYNNAGVFGGDADLTWTAAANGGLLTVSPGGLAVDTPSDYSQFITFTQYTSSYVGVSAVGNNGASGISFSCLDGSGNLGTGYFFALADRLKFQTPYITATATFGLVDFAVGQSGGGSLLGIRVSGSSAGKPEIYFYSKISTVPVGLALSNGANNDIVIPDTIAAVTGQTSFVRITGPTGVFNITGFAGGVDGQHLWIYNTTTQNMTLTNKATSSASNQINTMTGADVATTGEGIAHLIYDATTGFWLVENIRG